MVSCQKKCNTKDLLLFTAAEAVQWGWYPAAGKTTTALLNMPRARGSAECALDESEAFWQIKRLVMKATLLYSMSYPCLSTARLCVSSIMSYQSSPLWPAALCHLISSTRATCDCINKSLSLLDAIEILMSDHPKGDTWNEKTGGELCQSTGLA